MRTEFRRARIPEEIRSLLLFDRKAFQAHPGDWFGPDDWRYFEAWWMIIDNRKAGCCAFQANVDFQEDLRGNETNPYLKGSLYVATTGILPALQGLGLGRLMKSWQVSYARLNRFTRVIANTRRSNQRMIALNKGFGFKVLRTTSGYYKNPPEATVVMELLL